jgi:ubiquinone/menaquinone biosynthesis C-methylase UbiE
MARMDPDLKRARIYDEVAETYERVNLPQLFGVPGRVLADLVAAPANTRALDVGAGTGAVARALHASIGGGGLVVAADASPSMLRMAQCAGLDACVVTMLPALPFRDESFDVVTSAFVMTHLEDPDAMAREMSRVLRRGGRAALSAWLPATDDAAREWSRIIRTFMDASRLEAALHETLPGDGRFGHPGSLGDLLAAAGFEDVAVRSHSVECAMRVEDYIASRSVAATGRALQALLPEGDFDRLREVVRESLTAAQGPDVRFTRGFHSAVGRRPPS